MSNSSSFRRTPRQFPVLIVEDNPDQWVLIQAAFARCFTEIKPILISQPDQLLAYLDDAASDRLPVLILLDLYLPRREDGFALLTSLKTKPICKKLPVIILSSSQAQDDIHRAYELGVSAYIVKPDTFQELLVKLSAFRRYWWEYAALPRLNGY